MLDDENRRLYVDRVADEIDRQDQYFATQMRKHRVARVIVLTSAALVPLLSAIPDIPRWGLGALGATAALTEALIQLFRWRDSALGAQKLSAALTKETNLYNTQTEPYTDSVGTFTAFVTTVESLRAKGVESFNDLWGDDKPPSRQPGPTVPGESDTRTQ